MWWSMPPPAGRHHPPGQQPVGDRAAGGARRRGIALERGSDQQYLGEAGGRDRMRLLLNRFRKIPGFTEADAETAAGMKLLWKIPNQYFAVSTAIDRGVPLMQQNHTEIARAFIGLAGALDRERRGRETLDLVVVQDRVVGKRLYRREDRIEDRTEDRTDRLS